VSRTIIISKLAERKLDKLFEYLITKWSIKVKNEFINKLDKSISLIKEQPESFPSSEKEKGLRKCVITKQTTLYYRFDENKIKVVTIFDTRQNPQRLKPNIK
jgi:plasmid stabilization system protein ParE